MGIMKSNEIAFDHLLKGLTVSTIERLSYTGGIDGSELKTNVNAKIIYFAESIEFGYAPVSALSAQITFKDSSDVTNFIAENNSFDGANYKGNNIICNGIAFRRIENRGYGFVSFKGYKITLV